MSPASMIWGHPHVEKAGAWHTTAMKFASLAVRQLPVPAEGIEAAAVRADTWQNGVPDMKTRKSFRSNCQ